MQQLTDDEKDLVLSIPRYDAVSQVKNLSYGTLLLLARDTISRSDMNLLDWLEDIKIVLTDYHVVEKERQTFDGKTLTIKIDRYTETSNFCSTIDSDCYNRITNYSDTGKQPQSTFPYALEFLFENKSPHIDVSIQEHFSEGNFVYVKLIAEKRVYSRKRNGRSTTRNESVTHELVIEKWFKGSNVQFKTKGKEYFAKFEKYKKAKLAPKVEVIKIKNTINIVGIYGDMNAESEIKINTTKINTTNVDKSAYIEAFTKIKMSNAWTIIEVTKPYVTYNDGKVVQIDFVNDSFKGSQHAHRRSLPPHYFRINEFGGLVTHQLNERIVEELPDAPIDVVPESVEHLILPISEDERRIELEKFNYTYHELIALNKGEDVIEFLVKSKINDAELKQYAVLYGEFWVSTNKTNPRVKAFLEAVNFADTLIKLGEPDD